MRAAGPLSQQRKAAVVKDTTAELEITPSPQQQDRWRRRLAQIGLSLLVASAAFPIRFDVPGGHTASLFDLAVVACVALLALMESIRRTITYPPRRILLAILIPVLIAVASMWWSIDRVGSLLAAASWVEAIIVLTFVVLSLGEESPSHVIKWFAWLGLALLVAPILMYLHLKGFDPPAQISRSSGDFLSYYTRFSHPFLGRSNNLATLLVILYLPLAYWAHRYHRHRFAALAVGVAILLALSRGVLLALVISVLFMTMRGQGRAAKLARSLILPFCIALPIELIIMKTVPVVSQNIGGRASTAGVVARQHLLSDGAANLGHNLWIGAGAGAGASVHNTFLQQLIYFGLPLGIVVVVCLLQVPRWFFTVRLVNTSNHDLARACGWGVVAGYLTFLTESGFEGALLRPVIFLCFGLCVALTMAGLRIDGQTSSGNAFVTPDAGTEVTDSLMGADRSRETS